MAHDPFRGATRRPRPTVAAETAQDAFSGPPAGLTPDPPEVAPGAQVWDLTDGLRGIDGLSVAIDPPAQAFRDALAKATTEAQKPGYPCRLSSCGQVLASPGALGGHMAAHRKRGELD